MNTETRSQGSPKLKQIKMSQKSELRRDRVPNVADEQSPC